MPLILQQFLNLFLVRYIHGVPNYRKKTLTKKPPKFQAFWIKDTIHVLFLLIKLTGTLAIQVNELVYCGSKLNNIQHGWGGGGGKKKQKQLKMFI